MVIAYLAGLAVVLLLWRVFDGFVSKPVERPRHRWVVVADDGSDAARDPATEESDESAVVVESEDREPAA